MAKPTDAADTLVILPPEKKPGCRQTAGRAWRSNKAAGRTQRKPLPERNVPAHPVRTQPQTTGIPFLRNSRLLAVPSRRRLATAFVRNDQLANPNAQPTIPGAHVSAPMPPNTWFRSNRAMACATSPVHLPGNTTIWYLLVPTLRGDGMAKNTSIVLGDHFDRFIFAQLQDGRYGSASEVIRQALRLLEEHEQKVAALRQALIDGENSGNSTPLNMREIIRQARREAGVDV